MKKLATLCILFLIFNCEDKALQNELETLRTENVSLTQELKQASEKPTEQIITFLTFQNQDAEQAMNFYVSIFENSNIIEINRYEKGAPAPEGSIMMARFELNGSQFACSDSYIKHAWDFTPGVSNFIVCKTKEEQETLFNKLSKNGKVLMPLANYGFSQQFAFVEDQFGVSWQLNLD